MEQFHSEFPPGVMMVPGGPVHGVGCGVVASEREMLPPSPVGGSPRLLPGVGGFGGAFGGAVAGSPLRQGGYAVMGGSPRPGATCCVRQGATDCNVLQGPATSPTMGFVGTGSGSYVQETTYRFVGEGAGEFEVIEGAPLRTGFSSGLLCLAVGAVLLVGLLAFTVIMPTTTVRAVVVPPEEPMDTVSYDCAFEDEGWSHSHRSYCCESVGVGCWTPAPAPATSPPATSLPFDCDAGLSRWERGWSEGKKRWCCEHEGVACKLPATVPPTTSAPFDCEAGLARAETGWSKVKKEWCCDNEGKGCPPKCRPSGCDGTCYHDVDKKGHGHVTCRKRVEWAKEHSEAIHERTFAAAVRLVNQECDCQCACAEEDFERPEPALGVCLIWGDPHFTTFDGARADFYGQGQVWLVKSDRIMVQARYLATPYTNGLAATHDIAVGGPFTGGHLLKVGPLTNGGRITWDGQPILENFGTKDVGVGTIVYDDKGQLVDAAQEHLQKHIVHVSLPDNFFMQIFRWDNHINVRIRMPRQDGGQDGHCGNFDGRAADDSHDAIVDRIGLEVRKEDLLFNSVTERVPGKRLRVQDCPEERRKAAEKACRGVSDELTEAIADAGDSRLSEDELHGCVFDVCFAGTRYALQDQIEGW